MSGPPVLGLSSEIPEDRLSDVDLNKILNKGKTFLETVIKEYKGDPILPVYYKVCFENIEALLIQGNLPQDIKQGFYLPIAYLYSHAGEMLELGEHKKLLGKLGKNNTSSNVKQIAEIIRKDISNIREIHESRIKHVFGKDISLDDINSGHVGKIIDLFSEHNTTLESTFNKNLYLKREVPEAIDTLWKPNEKNRVELTDGYTKNYRSILSEISNVVRHSVERTVYEIGGGKHKLRIELDYRNNGKRYARYFVADMFLDYLALLFQYEYTVKTVLLRI